MFLHSIIFFMSVFAQTVFAQTVFARILHGFYINPLHILHGGGILYNKHQTNAQNKKEKL